MAWSNLTLREKIGQTMMIQNIDGYLKDFKSAGEFLEKYPIGGVYLGGAIIGGPMGGVDEFGQLIKEIQTSSKYPMFVAGDCERGELNTVTGEYALPFMMSLGAANDEALAYEYGKSYGISARNTGINWVFSPVTDLNTNPDCPIINIRSVGDNPIKAVPLLKQVIRGIQDCGVAATSKHFPGHGSEGIDPHIARTEIILSKEQWDNTYELVYKELIRDGVCAFMTGHASLPAYQSRAEMDENGLYNICTLSKELTIDLLKKQLGFEGVVVTDALMMGGFCGSSGDLEIKAFESGADILLWPSLEYMDKLEEKILSGEVSEKRLDDAVSRIWKMKVKLGLFDRKITYETTPKMNIAKHIARKSMTLLNNKQGLIPLNKSKIKNLLIVDVAPTEKIYNQLLKLKDVFSGMGVETEIIGDIWITEFEKKQDKFDLIIFAVYSGPGRPGSIDLCGDNAVSVWTSQMSCKQKTIIASFGSPYIYSKYYKHIDTYVNAYSYDVESMRAFAQAIFGEIRFEGVSPVNL